MLGASAIWTQIFWRYGTETSETRIIRELEFGENADIIIDNRGMATIELENPINGKKSLDLKAEDVRTAIVNGTKSQLEAIKKRDVTKVMGLKFFREKILYEIRISPFGIPLERLDTSPSFLSLNIS